MIRDLPLIASNFRNEQSLSDYLKSQNIVGIADIDTRKLTRILREKGAQNGCIVAGSSINGENLDEALALAKAKEFPGLKGMDLAKEVTTKKRINGNKVRGRLRVDFQKRKTTANCHITLLPTISAQNVTSCACWLTEAAA